MTVQAPSLSGAIALSNASKPGPRATSSNLVRTVIDLIAKDDPDKAALLLKKQEETNNLLKRLEAQRESMERQKKEMARQKVEQLKKELQMLQMLAITNPKAAARRAAQIAAELKKAVASYSAAGGSSGGDMQTLNMPNPSDTTIPTEETTTPQTFAHKAEQMVEEQTQSFGANKEDQEFAKEVQKVINLIKQVLATAKRFMSEEEEKDAQQADADLQSTQKELGNLVSVPLKINLNI